MKKRVGYYILFAVLILAFLVTGCKKKAKEDETSAKLTTQKETDVNTKAAIGPETKPEIKTSTEQATKEAATKVKSTEASETATKTLIDKNGSYYSKDDVALYIHTYGKLPSNFITKTEAKSLGWEGGSVEQYAKGKAIGGDKFGNFEGKLPSKKGRTYTECDIDTYKKSSRGAKRIIFSNDGLVYYTEDHYETFTLLYGEVN